MTHLKTKLIHAGELSPPIVGAVTLPIFQTSTYQLNSDNVDYHDHRYMRLSNSPNHLVLHDKLAQIECAEAALVTASGMAAISTTLLTFLKTGNHVLAQHGAYGGTHTFLANELPNWGIDTDFVDINDPDSWAPYIKPKTRVFYVETMSNPLLRVGDLGAIVDFAKQRNLITIIDNTLAGGININPIKLGFDLVVHSGSKYLNGHSDIVAGVVIGSKENIKQVKHKLDHFGGVLDSHACFLLHRGIKTLALRMAQQNKSGLALAQALESHRAVSVVHYPGLSSHPDAQRAQLLLNGFGGLLSFELNHTAESAKQLIEHLELATNAPSLGGNETLVCLPAQVTHAGLSPTELQQVGISESLIRVAVGTEETSDLITDFTQALDHISAR